MVNLSSLIEDPEPYPMVLVSRRDPETAEGFVQLHAERILEVNSERPNPGTLGKVAVHIDGGPIAVSLYLLPSQARALAAKILTGLD